MVPEGGEGDIKGIPEFWAKVFASHDAFVDILSTQDIEVGTFDALAFVASSTCCHI